jgi:enoyl-CoA hydratase
MERERNGKLPVHLNLEKIGTTAILTYYGSGEAALLSIKSLAVLHEAISRIASDDSVCAVIIEGGREGFFSAGADINELANLDNESSLLFSRLGQSIFCRLESLPKLVVAAVDGYCMGGGMDFLLACDIRLATPTSVFAHPGARMGIITGFGGTVRLPREIGRAKAGELFWSGRRVRAEEALEIGLINEITPRSLLRQRSIELCRETECLHRSFVAAFKGGSLEYKA